ncbi:ATP-binding protein involved in chromosome partitioning [Rubricella aquisinus]|uniref:Iron-sulfur cluster carrier protein n=1 Tax=Rubricella aquisinus TaxID=2028108 RepID=A0A840X1A7_9RHOB|nr:Mrp/NBP35 family ATP-binding protein [Rubricella aquisinus]MBB5517150.1 ATP-binding protein involved in chromosome partitioning [Rubricella aquisinus]
MSLTRDDVLTALDRIIDPDSGKSIVAADYVRAVTFDGANIRFILEVPPTLAPKYEPVRAAAEAAVKGLPGAGTVSALLTAHSSGPGQGAKAPPQLKIGGHPKPQAGPELPSGVKTIIAIGSGKGGVGKSTVSANLAVALAQAGKRVGLLDADVYGPSQPRMMGVNQRPNSPDGKTIIPLRAHGVTLMSIGLMLGEDQAVVWRGPMLMGALQQMLGQVAWGELDTLIVDLPPGTGDVQLTLCQKSKVSGAIVVSTPQDVALLDARKAVNMFEKLETPILGVVENMSTHICPNCGHESHIFGDGGARAFAAEKSVPFLGAVPLNIDIRLSGDEGAPLVAARPDAPEAQVFHDMAKRLIQGGVL